MRYSVYYKTIIFMIILYFLGSIGAFIFFTNILGVVLLIGALLFLNFWHKMPVEDKYR